MGKSMIMRMLLISVGICLYTTGISQQIQELTFDPMTMDGQHFITLTNSGGENNLEDYSTRPEYKFSGPEKIYKLPRMGGDFRWFVDGRTPDIEVDFFILTDPNDAGSSVMWMNGTGTKMRMTADPNSDYYLVIDGFPNKQASVQFSVGYAPDIPELCNNMVQIDLSKYLTTEFNEIMWSVKKEGGVFTDLDSGLFAPGVNETGKYTFLARMNNTNKPMAVEEQFCLIFKSCPIPTMSQWALFILALLFSSIAITTFKMWDTQATT